MPTRNIFGMLMIAGIFLLACRLSQPSTLSVEPTNTFQNTPPPPEAPIATETFVSTAPPVSLQSVDFEVRPWFPLQIPRTRHMATLLPNGKILLVGGSLEPDDFVADEELFNPITGLSDWTMPLHTPRHGHTATLLSDGRVLVIGGYSLPQQWISDAEVYDPTSDTWTVLPPLFSHGVNHTATRMQDGRVLVVGGCIGSGVCTDKVEILDPVNNSWVEAQSLKSDRASHTAQLLTDGRVLLIGGTGATSNPPIDGDGALYDPRTNTWTATGRMATSRLFAESVLLPSGKVLTAGGILFDDPLNLKLTTTTELYDPILNTWSPTGELAEARYAFVLISNSPGQVMAIGGTRDWECCWNENSFVKEIEAYDPKTNQWQIIGELPQPRAYATGILLPNGRVWIAGGQYGQTGTAFPPETWLIIPPLH